ncbi:pentatricopeptide repeat-containing protein At1g71490-like [Dendrobium catenatum]|uniref:Pentatricopeptide repeat-containing protein n=1 Tax=Dendrobium catenatum TaxID=906689 RepID=A0A2I0WSX6_9ASPA|nr:pentatricopeptide repeat-containing protein At1g71490-like [Dendrobium catenatum]PKU78765.1 Pentatricopeptide repeat-containing protein [Dendrobium catenatum]
MPCTTIPQNFYSLVKQIKRCSPRSQSWRRPPPANQAERLVASIRHLSSSHRIAAALVAFSQLRRYLSHPLSRHLDHPISSLLAAATHLRSFSHGSGLHALSFFLGLLPANRFTVSRIAAFYAAFGLLDSARAAVEDSSTVLAFPWNIVISAYLEKGYWQDAIFSYGMMLERGIKPDKFSISSVLKACGELRELGLGKEVHRHIVSSDLECDLFVYNALLAMYAKCGAVDNARKVFDEMPERDIVSWNSMVLGYSSQGRWDETSEFLERMRLEGFELNSVTSNTIICGLVHSSNHREALTLISQTRQRKAIYALYFVSLLLGLKACSVIRYQKQGKEIHGLAIRSNFDELENISNALITLYSKCHNIGYARIVFQKSSARSAVTWNSMIAAFAGINKVHEAALLLQEMIGSRTQPSQTTIVTMLALCADSADLWYGTQLHCYAIRHGFEHYLPIANSIVDMYCKSGRVSVARKVFDMMAGHDKISYTALIAGYALQREGIAVRKLIDEMISRGIEPDQIMIEVIRSVWSRLRNHGGGLFAWNHSSVAALVQHG